jgi:hypothetical protein
MAKFLTGNELNAEIEKLFESASEQLILISPFVKLHSRYKSSLLTKQTDCNLKITVVFGKNEYDLSKSFPVEDIEFFKHSPNIEIRYERRLHAKYYANERAAILSSMNLYSYSHDNNIEAGVLMTPPIGRSLGLNIIENLDTHTFNYFQRVIGQSSLLFSKIPQFESGLLGLTKKYIGSTVVADKLEGLDEREKKYKSEFGYCIATGQRIPFNIEQPLCETSYKLWRMTGDKNFKGNYCHYSGEEGATTYSKPILWKNWKNV